jgi:hypothetical protein
LPLTPQISVTDPFGSAFEQTRRILFRPFDMEKWLVLGFCAWIAQLGEGGTNINWRQNVGQRFDSPNQAAYYFREWIVEHLDRILLVAAIVIPLSIAVWIVMTWVSSRGKFLFVEGVINNRAAVVDPWRRHKQLGNSLFGLRLAVGLIGFVCLVGWIAGMLALLWPAIRDESFDGATVLLLIGGLLFFFALILVFVLLQVVINDWVVPLMYGRRQRVGPALAELRELIGVRPGTMLLYLLFRLLIGIGVGFVAFIAVLCSCCVAALPYIGTVILLPLHVFVRSFSLHFVSQLDPAHARMGPPPPAPPGAPPAAPPTPEESP